jgi:hypothetical protein
MLVVELNEFMMLSTLDCTSAMVSPILPVVSMTNRTSAFGADPGTATLSGSDADSVGFMVAEKVAGVMAVVVVVTEK